jgi:hypothetical protein
MRRSSKKSLPRSAAGELDATMLEGQAKAASPTGNSPNDRQQRNEVRSYRKNSASSGFKSVDTCAAEFEAYTPYYYSTYEDEDELPPKGDKKRVMILGGGPNRIGQGIEFDYCCCHASFALRELGSKA